MTDRAPCIVPGCPNSSAKYAGGRYICSTHWRGVPSRLKRRRSRIARRLEQRDEITDVPGVFYQTHTRRAHRLLWASWVAMERAAIRAAAGI